MEHSIAMEPMKGKWGSSRVDFGYPELFCIPEVTSVFISSCEQCSWGCSGVPSRKLRLITCLTENTGLLCTQCRGIEPHPRREGYLMGFLELLQEPGVYSQVTAGMAIRTSPGSAKSGLLSSYDGHLTNLN